MTMIIEIQSREWDTVNITAALKVPAEREYVAKLTVDDENAQIVFDGDVQLVHLDGDTLTVAEWSETGYRGAERTFDVADIRRIEFY